MAIQLRRGNEADLDISRLMPGEAAVCLDSGKIIVKLSGGNYLTLTDTDAIQEIVAGKAPASHSHDDRYYTETEIDNKLDAKQNALTAGNGISISNGEITNSAPNTQADWNQSDITADDFIKNKPDLSVYAPATLDNVGSWNMTYNNMVSDGTTYPNTVTLQKNANNYRLLLVRYYVTRLGGVQLWDYKVIPAPNVAAQSLLLKAFGLSGGTLTEYIFGLQFSADGTTITLTYGENDISLAIRIWGIK